MEQANLRAQPGDRQADSAIEVPRLRILEQRLWDAVQARLEGIRQSPSSQKQRRSEFWRHRRPKHLLTGLVHCGECGGLMGAIGKDYLACTAARSGARCKNRKSVRRHLVENAVLEGLKSRLMEPERVKEFVASLHEEVNRQCLTEELRVAEQRADLA